MYIETTETYLRFYVLLSQYLDRCLDDQDTRVLI